MLTITYSQVCRKQGPVLCRPSKKILTSSMRHPCLIIRILFLTKTNKTLAIMQVDSRSGGYIFSQSRRAY